MRRTFRPSQELAAALRGLRRRPGAALSALLSLLLTIGAIALVATWYETFVGDPLPGVPRGSEVVVASPAAADGTVRGMPGVTWEEAREWRASLRSFASLGVWSYVRPALRRTAAEAPRPVWGQLVDDGYFAVAGVQPQLGRLLAAGDLAAASPVVVLSDAFWRRELGGVPDVLGRKLSLQGQWVEVVGVAPAGFGGLVVGLGLDFWLPATLEPAIRGEASRLRGGTTPWLVVVGRLREGVTRRAAEEELAALVAELDRRAGAETIRRAAVRRLDQTQAGALTAPALRVLALVAALLLLVAAANLASAMLAIAHEERRGWALRLALGAGRVAAVRPWLLQVGLLLLAGGAGGLLLASRSAGLLERLLPYTPLPFAPRASTSPASAAWAIAAALAVLAVVGVALLLVARRWPLGGALRGTAADGGRMRLRRLAMGAQVAVCAFCLALGALLGRSLDLLESPALGFADVDRTLVASVDWTASGLDQAAGEARSAALLARLAALPGVEAAGAATMLPLGFGGHSYVTPRIAGYVPAPGEDLAVELVGATDGYLEALGVPVVAGRGIAPSDGAATPPVAVVNRELVRRFFRDGVALGRTLDWGAGPRMIVGVVGNAVFRDLGEPPYPMAFVPMFQSPAAAWHLHLRSRGAVVDLLPAVRREVARAERGALFLDPRTLARQATAAGFGVTFAAALTGSLGGVVALLVAAGLYGLLDTLVRERRGEMAVRLAVGASPRQLRRGILGRGLRPVAAGLLLGMPLAVWVAGLLPENLGAVDRWDPLALAATAVALLLLAVAAVLLPTRAAGRIDPAKLLRGE
jgi:predicted permease